MLDKFLSVSPPQVGALEKNEFANDFKLGQQSKNQQIENKKDEKSFFNVLKKTEEKSDLKTDRRLTGGTKKKLAKSDDEDDKSKDDLPKSKEQFKENHKLDKSVHSTSSNHMASSDQNRNENEVEDTDSDKNLSQVENKPKRVNQDAMSLLFQDSNGRNLLSLNEQHPQASQLQNSLLGNVNLTKDMSDSTSLAATTESKQDSLDKSIQFLSPAEKDLLQSIMKQEQGAQKPLGEPVAIGKESNDLELLAAASAGEMTQQVSSTQAKGQVTENQLQNKVRSLLNKNLIDSKSELSVANSTKTNELPQMTSEVTSDQMGIKTQLSGLENLHKDASFKSENSIIPTVIAAENSQHSSEGFANNFSENKKDSNFTEKKFDSTDIKKTSLQDGSLNQNAAGFSGVLTAQQSDIAHRVAYMNQAALGDTSTKVNHQSENLEAIMNQAKVLIKDGGGEVSVKMTPEGMGEVHLRVMLDQGQVHLEINSKDKDVKRLIEDNLVDLKSSLAIQQIKVDHIKVNDVAQTDSQNKTQNQFNQSNQQQHQNQQQSFSDSLSQRQEGQQNARRDQQSRNSWLDQNQASNDVLDRMKQVQQGIRRQSYTDAKRGSSLNMVA